VFFGKPYSLLNSETQLIRGALFSPKFGDAGIEVLPYSLLNSEQANH